MPTDEFLLKKQPKGKYKQTDLSTLNRSRYYIKGSTDNPSSEPRQK